jgi:probable HAF family extracellular repeat protein
MQSLGLPSGAYDSSATAINGDGTTVVGFAEHSGGYKRAFIWNATTGMTSLGVPFGWSTSLAADVTDDGSIVVGSGSSGRGTAAFIWQSSIGMQSLADFLSNRAIDLTGWTSLTEAEGITPDGRFITGWGVYNGSSQGFLIDLGAPIPGPAAIAVVLMAGARRDRRRHQ